MSDQFKNYSSVTVFDIHLIQQEICKHLTVRDIRRCCLVSHNLYQNFTPYLYHTINITRKSTFNLFCRQESLNALHTYRNRVSEVTCYFAQIWKILSKYQCFGLTVIKSPSLKYRPQNRDANMMYTYDVISLAQACQRLRVLEIGYFPYDGSAVEPFCQMIRDHDTLREVEINHYQKALYSKVMLILWSGLRLERLSIRIRPKSNLTDKGDILEYVKQMDEITKQQNVPSRLKILMIKGSLEYGTNQIVLTEFLKRCPSLTHLGLPWGTSLLDIPNIQHLDLSAIIFRSGSAAQLIKSCEALTSFVGGRFSIPSTVVPNLVSNHSETLQELDLILSRTSSPHIPFIFISFPNLKVLKLMTPYSITSQESERMLNPVLDINILSHSSEPWVCRNLQTLTLWHSKVVELVEGSSSYDQVSYDDIFPKMLYERIGQLTELNLLWIGHVEISEVDHLFSLDRNLQSEVVDPLPVLESDHTSQGINALQRLSGLSKLENFQLRRTRKYFTNETIEDLKKVRMYWPSLKRMLIT